MYLLGKGAVKLLYLCSKIEELFFYLFYVLHSMGDPLDLLD